MNAVLIFAVAALFSGGKSEWCVVTGENPPAEVAAAAAEFTNAVFRVSGAAIPVVASSARKDAVVEIVAKGPDRTDIDEKDGYRAKDGRLQLVGNQPRAALHATYQFLQRELGVRWIGPGPAGEIYPPRETYEIPQGLKYAHVPTIRYRGFHINATSDFGNVGWYDGIVMSGGYTLDISVKGKSAHTAYPEYAVNPIVILSRVAVAIDGLKQTIRATQPYTVSMMHMDCPHVAYSASPEKGRLIVKTRYHEPEVNERLKAKIREIVKMYCDLYGATYEIAEEQGLEPTCNLPEMGPVVRENAAAFGLPLEHIFASMGGDDFGYYGWKVPAYYMTFGLRTSKDFPIAHTAKFDWDEKVLPGSAAMFASCALRREYPKLPAVK